MDVRKRIDAVGRTVELNGAGADAAAGAGPEEVRAPAERTAAFFTAEPGA
ncbi:hypothetical protein NGM33_14705 [Nocardiopsis dassonvillei]|nr:hypothetical protein [Nocardiopsis dassonvillei]MCP3014581.1 hypothetical protein [Nocardiopsis dassonvillei]